MYNNDDFIYLITGGSGFIGTNLISELSKFSDKIHNVDIKSPNDSACNNYWVQCDILDSVKLEALFSAIKPTHVIHLAARTDVNGNSLADYEVNTQGTLNVLNAIKKVGTVQRTIITSTQFVNQSNGYPLHDEDYAPHTVYGQSKVETERLTRSAGLDGIWTIIRPTNIWGPWHPRYPFEFWRIIGQGKYIHPGGGKVVRSYGYVKNVVWQILKMCAAEPEIISGKVFYVGDQPIDLLQWVNGFSREQINRDVIVVPRLLVRFLGLIGDLLKSVNLTFPITTSRYQSMTTSNSAPMEKTFSAFGKPPYSLEEGIQETVRWLKISHPGIVKSHIQ